MRQAVDHLPGRAAAGLGVDGALALMGWALSHGPALLVLVALALAVACLVAIIRPSVPGLGVVFVVLFAVTASWDQASIGGVKPRMIFMLLGLLFLMLGHGIRRPPRVPWWLHAYGVTAVLVTGLQVLFPADPGYLAGRYQTSEAGTALGERPEALASLLSLLVNNYAVPIAVVLACMYLPKALNWIVAAYVSGAALSSLAAYLGFVGIPALLDLMVVPPPAGVRAAGFTSHPLHLATSQVFAVALACWMATRSGLLMRWGGRVGLGALLLGVYASGSRGGVVACVVALALCAVLLPDLRRRMHLVVGAAMAGLVVVLLLAPGLIEQILATTRLAGGAGTQVSDLGRGEVLEQGLHDFAHAPLWGIGVRYLAEAHVLYVGLLAAGGILLLLAFLLHTLGSLLSATANLGVDRALAGALLATLLGSFVYWMVADDFQVASVNTVYGMIIALSTMPRSATPGPEEGAGTGAEVPGEGVLPTSGPATR